MNIKRVKYPLLIVAAIGVVYSLLPFTWQWKIIQYPLEIGEDIEPNFGDAIIVPGAGCNPGCGTEERLNLAYSMYKVKPRKIIVSESFCFPFERRNFKDRMVKQWGFDKEDILWDTLSKTTIENFTNSLRICKDSSWNNIIVATSRYHQLRSYVIMGKLHEGEFKIAKMQDEQTEMEHYEPYLLKKPRTIVGEYLKIIHTIIFL